MSIFHMSNLLMTLTLLVVLLKSICTNEFIHDTLTSIEDQRVNDIRKAIQKYLNEDKPNDNSKLIPLSLYHRKESNYLIYKLIAFHQQRDASKISLCEFKLKYTNEIIGDEDKGTVIAHEILKFPDEVSIHERRYLSIFEAIDAYFKKHLLFSFNLLYIRGFYQEDIDEYFYCCVVRLTNGNGDFFYFVNQNNAGVFTLISTLFIDNFSK